MGYVSEDGTGDLKHSTEYGKTVNGNMIDIAVLEWCKLFADRNGHHHWHQFVQGDAHRKQSCLVLAKAACLEVNAFLRYLDEMRTYRDKFVAHLDELSLMVIPRLEPGLKSSFFLYKYIHHDAPEGTFDLSSCAHLPSDLQAYYNACRADARLEYV
jgi:hypothetical protein